MQITRVVARRGRVPHLEGLAIVPGADLALDGDTVDPARVAAAGARAVATTSAGVAWSHGSADGNRLPRADAVAAIAAIVRAVGVP